MLLYSSWIEQWREALNKWRSSQVHPTPKNLIKAFYDGKLVDYVNIVCKVLGTSDETAGAITGNTGAEGYTQPPCQPPRASGSQQTMNFLESMTAEQLEQWLLQKLGKEHSDNIKKLRENDINGKTFISLTDDVLKNDFSILSWGFRHEVLELLKECTIKCATDSSLPVRPEITHYLLDEMKWETTRGLQKISIYKEAAHTWPKVATKLGLGPGEIDGIRNEKLGKEIDCVRSVIGKWLDNTQGMENSDKYPKTWKGLIALLDDSELTELAKNVQETIRHQKS